MEFSQPIWFLLLLLVPALWFWPSRLEDRRIGILRSVAAVLLIAALARPTLPGTTDRAHHVMVFDATASAAAPGESSVMAAAPAVLNWERGLDDATSALVTVSATAASSENSPWDRNVHIAGDGSPLGAALTAAGTLIPSGSPGSITLVSDGHSTEADWGDAVAALSARGVPVHVSPLDGPPVDDLRPVGFRVQEPIRVGSTVRAEVDVIGATRARITLTLADPNARAGSTLLAETEVDVAGRTTVPMTFEAEVPGFLPIEIAVEAVTGNDRDSTTNRLSTEIAVDDPLRVLYLGERVVEGESRLGELVGAGFEFESRGSLESEATPALDPFDLVLLDDRPAKSVPESFQRDVADAVETRGLGLVMAGGGGSFGPGGYHETPIASSLPVEFVQKEEKKDPSTALAIIIDTSGSMGGNRMTLAKEVARLAIRRMLPHDKVGIVEFYGTKNWAAPLQSAANAIDIQRALNRLDAGGGTILLPAIEEAYYGLRNMQTRYKHVLVLTDAGVETGPYESLLRRMARDGICVSTVLVGSARHGEFLVQLADWGNGRYYNASDRFNLPEIMLKQPSTARLPGYRPGNHTLEPRGGEGWWGEVNPTSVPSVAGYVETRARPGSEVVLRTKEEGHPVLASWRTGLGRVTTMMTEPVGPGTESWQSWDDYGAFLARVLTRTASDALGAYRFSLEEEGVTLRVVAERRMADAPPPRATRRGADGTGAEELTFVERAPGVYVSTVGRARDEAVRIEAGTAATRRITRLVSPANAGRAPERQVDPDAALDLAALAEATGGSTIALSDLGSVRPLAGGATRAPAIRELTPWLLVFALLTYLAEITVRRLPRSRAGGAGSLPLEASS